MAGQVPVGTFCRVNNIMVAWDDPTDGHHVDMFVSQEEDEDLYFAIVLQHDDVKGHFGVRRLVRCLALGFETGSDNTFWMLGSQNLEPLELAYRADAS
jgi:hypothetical protein